jgi:ATP-binding cassette subfamily B protein
MAFKKYPYYSQLDQMDCGPTCLRMIAKYYGKSYSLNDLRKKTFITREGVSLLDLSHAAGSIGLRTLGVKISFEQLRSDVNLPCIIHWNQSHFTVVYEVAKKSVLMADPMGGIIRYTTEEFIRSWQQSNEGLGIALLLETTPEFFKESETQGEDKNNFSRIFSYVRPYKWYVIQLILGLFLGSLIQLAFPFLTQSIVDVGINHRNMNFIYLILTGQIMLFLGRTTIDLIRRWILLQLGSRINLAIISDFLIKILRLPLSFFNTKMVGDILQRVDDHSRIERFINSSSLNIIFSLFNLIIFGIVLAIYSVKICLVFIGFSFLYLLYTILFLKKRSILDFKRFHQLSHNQSMLVQLIGGVAELKINNAETKKLWEWENIQVKIFKLNNESMKLQQFQDAGSSFINELKNILITIMAAMAVIKGQMTLGMMLSIQFIIGQLNSPITEFIVFLREWQDAKLSFSRINEIHLLENEDQTPTDDWNTFNQLPISNTIKLKGVSFRYGGPGSSPILHDVSFEIPEGKVTAIVGASGSGKTTLLKLLLKFYSVSTGQITIGEDVDINNVPSNLWRKQCGVVMQDGYIFSDTIANNITLSSSEVDYPKLLNASKIAGIHDFIEILPLRYSTKLGEDGVGLSGGQRQRILIARAVYKDPQILFFDEATSSLDSKNERSIVENLQRFYQDRTVVVVAHRLSTVKNADQIIVLDNGRVSEIGNHKSLVARNGNYYDLVKNQLELGNSN